MPDRKGYFIDWEIVSLICGQRLDEELLSSGATPETMNAGR